MAPSGIFFDRPGYSFGIPNALLAEEDALYATGDFRIYPQEIGTPVLRWTGDQWANLDTLSATGTCLIRYRGELMLGTSRNSSPGPPDAGVYRWSGAKWHAVGLTAGVNQFHGVQALTVHDGILVAGGSFISIGGIPANGVAAWNGTSWQSFGVGPVPYQPRPNVVGLVSHDGKLIAAGGFLDSSGGVPLMVWDGKTWDAFPGIRGRASALSLIRGKLFLSGDLQLEASDEKTSAVMWDGQAWRPMGSGVNGQILAFQESNGSLYAGGYFSAAGGKSSFGIARWNGLLSPAPGPGALWLSQGRPNPFRAASDFSFEIKHGGRVIVAVYDVQGREVAIIEDRVRPPGAYDARWDGREASGKRVAAGIYFISVRQSDGSTTSRKVVLLE